MPLPIVEPINTATALTSQWLAPLIPRRIEDLSGCQLLASSNNITNASFEQIGNQAGFMRITQVMLRYSFKANTISWDTVLLCAKCAAPES